jgi:hypothetical protein
VERMQIERVNILIALDSLDEAHCCPHGRRHGHGHADTPDLDTCAVPLDQ